MGLLGQLYSQAWLLAAATAFVFVGRKVRTYNRLRAFPGPRGTGWSELWHVRALMSWRSHLWYDEVINKYGPIVRVGPNELITSSPELLTHMSAVRSPYTRGHWFNEATRFQPGRDHVFSLLDEEKHTQRRAQMAAGYSGKENVALESSLDDRIFEFIQLIRTKYLSTEAAAKPLDFARKIQYLTLDVISTVGFGEPFGDLTTDSDVHGYVENGELGLWINSLIMTFGLTRLFQIPFLARNLGPSERDEAGLGRLIANARKIISARVAKDMERKSDMLASFHRHGLSEEELISEACLQVLAGSDTSAAALRGIFLYLLAHPRVYAKLQAEVDEAVERGDAPAAGDVISDAQVRELKYLNAVIREGMRVHPPVTDEVPKKVPPEGDTVVIEGKSVFLPGGTLVGYAVWPLNFNKAIFGEDADSFRPERWLLETDEKRLATMHRTHELVFGYGKWQCLGRPIAMMEIGKAVFELMRHFDWCLAKPETPWRETNYSGIFVHSDMWVLASDRLG